jgi:hypothetical protein
MTEEKRSLLVIEEDGKAKSTQQESFLVGY